MNQLPKHIVTQPADISPEWLSEILRRARLLTRGSVESIRAELVLEYNSTIYRLHPAYSPDAPAEAPKSLILKLKEGNGARDELELGLKLDSHRAALPMLIDWYDAAWSDSLGRAHFLMRDLSGSHVQSVSVIDATAGRPVPPQAQLEQMIDTIAGWHAYWWEHPHLDRKIGPIHGGYRNREQHEREIMRNREAQLAVFLQQEGDSLPAELCKMFERSLPRLRILYERHIEPRLSSKKNVTLIHGDCYFGQFLCPKDSSRDRVYLIDLESANTYLAAMDLAFMFASFWTRANRHDDNREMNCLARYHARLCEGGMHDFTFEQLLTDYRVAISQMIFYPIWDAIIGKSRRTYWWPKMQCLCAAFEDLQCQQLSD